MTMLERVAAELGRGVCKRCRKPCAGEGGGITDCGCSRPEWDNPTPIEQARAILDAMPPFEALLREARNAGPINPYNEHADLAERIDAALKAAQPS
jgi:hypothetical protein